MTPQYALSTYCMSLRPFHSCLRLLPPHILYITYSLNCLYTDSLVVNTHLNYSHTQSSSAIVLAVPHLYDMHHGRQPPLCTFSSVRVAIQRLLQCDAQLRSLEFAPDLQSNTAFSDEEHRCLLQALLDGTIQPDLYRGLMLRFVG